MIKATFSTIQGHPITMSAKTIEDLNLRLVAATKKYGKIAATITDEDGKKSLITYTKKLSHNANGKSQGEAVKLFDRRNNKASII